MYFLYNGSMEKIGLPGRSTVNAMRHQSSFIYFFGTVKFACCDQVSF